MLLSGKLLVVTGDRHTEIIDLLNTDITCDNPPDYPYQVTQATGGLISNLPLVCGGNTYDGSYISKCFVIGSYNTDEIELIHPRQASASLSLDDTLWITGSLTFSAGKNKDTKAPKTSIRFFVEYYIET